MRNPFFPHLTPPERPKRDGVFIPKSQADLLRLQMAETRIRGEAARKASAWVDLVTGAILLAVILVLSLTFEPPVTYWDITGPLVGLGLYAVGRITWIRYRMIQALAEIHGEVAPPTEPE